MCVYVYTRVCVCFCSNKAQRAVVDKKAKKKGGSDVRTNDDHIVHCTSALIVSVASTREDYEEYTRADVPRICVCVCLRVQDEDVAAFKKKQMEDKKALEALKKAAAGKGPLKTKK